jgi:hypothetical protein
MALPKLETPIFKESFVGSKKTYRYRPFRTKEQKALLIAAESGSEEDIITSLVSLVNACTFDEIDWYKQPVVEFERAFLNIRAKSIGEMVDLIFRCNANGCGHKNEIRVDVREAEAGAMPNGTIEVEDNIFIVFEPILVEDMLKQKTEDLVCEKVKMVVDGEKVIEDFTQEEIMEFIDSLPPKATKKIQDFFETQPTLKLNIPTKCEKCGTESKIVLEGVLNFFG